MITIEASIVRSRHGADLKPLRSSAGLHSMYSRLLVFVQVNSAGEPKHGKLVKGKLRAKKVPIRCIEFRLATAQNQQPHSAY